MGRCRDCGGTGTITCPVCNGTGVDPRASDKDAYERVLRQYSQTCGYCNGRGRIPCPACSGTGDNPYD